MAQEIRADVLKLMEQKDKIENEIKELTDILTLNGVGMNDSLVDSEGFPISSVDVYQVRNARHRIICLQNDHKGLMKRIEAGLQGYYSAGNDSNSQAQNIEEMQVDRPARIINKDPFAKITLVSPLSPAEYAGFLVDDQVVEFGSINATNFKNVADIANLVQHSEGSPVNVKLKRGTQFITTQILPKRWQGKGLLGCHIVGN